MMNKNSFVRIIAEWYQLNKRVLPWRETRDSYRIWLSEIILQQTRVSQGLPYYQRFIEKFPNVEALARATEEDVLRVWQGLGYYTRARNLRRCAKVIVDQHHGRFPDTFMELQKLPGIGVYTAAAIASVAFLEPVAVVDGNVYRVLARVFGIESDISFSTGKDEFFRKAQSLVPAENPDEFNQAMMEFGALHCLPQNPKCDSCVFARVCVAYARSWQDRLPVKTKKPKVRRRYFYYFVMEQDTKLGLQKRINKDIWHGLYDFYLVETTRPQKPEFLFQKDKLLKSLGGKIQRDRISKAFTHVLSHQKLIAHFVPVEIKSSKARRAVFNSIKLKFYSNKGINELPKPVLVSRYLKVRRLL